MDNCGEGFLREKESPRRKAGAKPEDIMKGKGIGQKTFMPYDMIISQSNICAIFDSNLYPRSKCFMIIIFKGYRVQGFDLERW
jgi:hypothetical protein